MPAVIVACFVLSGATSLILQVVWVRLLIDVFGSSTLAISTVLATFMGGLALGAWLGGRLADRLDVRRRVLGDPLVMYGACEALVAACALVIPIVVGNYRGANAWLWSQLGDAPFVLSLARFGLSGVVLLLPTTCMGATLPLLSRRVTQSDSDLGLLGRRVGVLYAANTAGAVAGAAAAGFWLIPSLGVSTTNAAAATLAGLLAIAVVGTVWLRRGNPTVVRSHHIPLAPSGMPPPICLNQAQRRLVIIAFGISGAVAMSLEVLWSRAVALVVGSSIYSFSLVLVVFLIGIATGAAAVTRRASSARDPLASLALLFAAVAGSVLVTHTLTDDLPGVFVALVETTSLSPSTVLSIHALLIGLLILPTSLCLGAVMPLVIRAYAGSLDAVGADVGRAYACNTVGAIIGAFAGGFVILPVVGLEDGVRAAIVVEAVLAIVLAAASAWHRRHVVAVVAAAFAVAALVVPSWDKSALTAGVFRVHVAQRYIDQGGMFSRQVEYYADGVATTVSVEWGVGPILKNNGKVEASTVHDMPTQILLGLLPVLVHPAAEKTVFIIGYGSGITVGAALQSPQVSRVDVVELEPEVYVAADRFFSEYNHRPQADPRAHRHVGDGRNFLLAGERRYDIIVSEPSNPWIAGVASLFTQEFYRFAASRLAPGGVFCQWVQLYELGPRNVKMIYKTFAQAFPYVYAFTPAAHSSDTFLLGAMRPMAFDLPGLRRAFAQPSVKAELERAQTRSPEQLIANLFIGPDELSSFTAGADVNTDDNARLEYLAPRDLMNAAQKRLALASSIFNEGWPYGRLEGLVTGLGRGADRIASQLALASELLSHGRRREAKRWFVAARKDGASQEALAELGLVIDLTDRRTVDDPELPVATLADPLPLAHPSLFAADEAIQNEAAAQTLAHVYGLFASGRWQDAWAIARDMPRRADNDGGRDVTLLMGYLAYKAIHFETARTLLDELVDRPDYARRRPAAGYYAGRVAYGMGKFARGVVLLRTFARAAPQQARTFTKR